MSKFKVGDRIVSYGFSGRLVGTVTMMNYDSSGRLSFNADDGAHYNSFPQQCRKLVKKPKKRIWVPNTWSDNSLRFVHESWGEWLFKAPRDSRKNLFTEYVEVKKK